MLFTIQRWLKPGGIVLIDEPDLHLHPSVIAPLLAAIENIVTNKKRAVNFNVTLNRSLATL